VGGAGGRRGGGGGAGVVETSLAFASLYSTYKCGVTKLITLQIHQISHNPFGLVGRSHASRLTDTTSFACIKFVRLVQRTRSDGMKCL
jgi:hypothetical protein